jgi:hypothetical protein
MLILNEEQASKQTNQFVVCRFTSAGHLSLICCQIDRIHVYKLANSIDVDSYLDALSRAALLSRADLKQTLDSLELEASVHINGIVDDMQAFLGSNGVENDRLRERDVDATLTDSLFVSTDDDRCFVLHYEPDSKQIITLWQSTIDSTKMKQEGGGGGENVLDCHLKRNFKSEEKLIRFVEKDCTINFNMKNMCIILEFIRKSVLLRFSWAINK